MKKIGTVRALGKTDKLFPVEMIFDIWLESEGKNENIYNVKIKQTIEEGIGMYSFSNWTTRISAQDLRTLGQCLGINVDKCKDFLALL
jgi:hypothetical protein